MLSYSIPSWSQAFIHHDPRKFQPEPFRQFFDGDCEPLKLKAGDLHDRARTTRHQDATANVPVRAKRMDRHRIGRDEVSLVWLHHCSLFLPASIRMWVRSSTSGIRRDEVSMSRFSFRNLQSCISSSLIRSSCLRASSSIIMVGAVYASFSGRPIKLSELANVVIQRSPERLRPPFSSDSQVRPARS